MLKRKDEENTDEAIEAKKAAADAIIAINAATIASRPKIEDIPF